MSLSEEDRARRLAAKRHNERMKLMATTFNAIAIVVAGAAVILPAINDPGLLVTIKPWILISSAFGLHLVAHTVLNFIRSKD